MAITESFWKTGALIVLGSLWFGCSRSDTMKARQVVWVNDGSRQAVSWHLGGKQGNEKKSWALIAKDGVPGWNLAAMADFNRDGIPDVVWVNDTNRQAIIWYLGGKEGNEKQSWAWICQDGLPGWQIATAADFNKDGVPDVLWVNDASRQAVIWYLGGKQGNEKQGWSFISQDGLPGWRIAATADFNRDGNQDVVWVNDANRHALVWYLGGKQGNEKQGWSWLTQDSLSGWRVATAGDFNGDGMPDVVCINDSNRQAVIWYLGGKQGTDKQSWSWLSRDGLAGWRVRAAWHPPARS